MRPYLVTALGLPDFDLVEFVVDMLSVAGDFAQHPECGRHTPCLGGLAKGPPAAFSVQAALEADLCVLFKFITSAAPRLVGLDVTFSVQT